LLNVEIVGKEGKEARSWVAWWMLRNRREESSGFGQRSDERMRWYEEK
jgi:hypothetical protein